MESTEVKKNPPGGKEKADIDAGEVVDRMLAGKGYETLAELASFLGLSAQALGNSRIRGSISLSLLVKYCKRTGISLDHLVFGKKTDYIALEPVFVVDDGEKKKTIYPPIAFDRPWLENVLRVSPSFARYYVDTDGSVLIIDTSHAARQITDGSYAIKSGGTVIVRKCRSKITGAIAIEGEEQDLSAEQLTAIEVLGRVAMRCQSC